MLDSALLAEIAEIAAEAEKEPTIIKSDHTPEDPLPSDLAFPGD